MNGWTKTSEHRPQPGALIVKRWLPSGAVWAGVYGGTDKDSSFDEWIELPTTSSTPAHSKSEYKRCVAMGDASILPPAPVAVQPAPVAWQWRRKGDPWTLEKTFNSEVFATTADSEVRALYASPSPAPVADLVVTDAQIEEIAARMGARAPAALHWKEFARAILAAQSGAGARGDGQ